MKRKNNETRYFLVSYRSNRNVGHTTIYIEDGRFLNQKLFIEVVKRDNPNVEWVVITNIMEMTKEDYKDFIDETLVNLSQVSN